MAGIYKELKEYRRSVIASRYEAEGSVPIAKELGLTRDAVLKMATRMGLFYNRHKYNGAKIKLAAARPDSGFNKRAENSDSCDIRFFDGWSSDMSYILGYLYADGSIDKKEYRVRLHLNNNDVEVLKYVREKIKVKGSIRFIPEKINKSNNTKTKPSCYLDLNSKILVKKLIDIGIKPNKTYTDEEFPNVPVEYIASFIRGFFDGDGTVAIGNRKRSYGGTSCSIKFIGTPKFITTLTEKLVDYANMTKKSPSIVTGKKAIWSVVGWSRTQDLINFRNFLYENGKYIFCLERKRERLNNWLFN